MNLTVFWAEELICLTKNIGLKIKYTNEQMWFWDRIFLGSQIPNWDFYMELEIPQKSQLYKQERCHLGKLMRVKGQWPLIRFFSGSMLFPISILRQHYVTMIISQIPRLFSLGLVRVPLFLQNNCTLDIEGRFKRNWISQNDKNKLKSSYKSKLSPYFLNVEVQWTT